MPIELPRGTRDLGPADAIRLNEISTVIEETFKDFGFSPLDTPAIENLSVISAKTYGSDSNNEIFVIDGKEMGLRYDLTVPLARFVAMNKGLQMPFKRYQIAKAWRKDEPQKMRGREFIQADIDVVGSKEPISDAECIAAAAMSIERLGMLDYTILINSRGILNAILDMFKIDKAKHGDTIRILDKMEKLSKADMIKMFGDNGIDSQVAQSLINFVEEDMANEEKIKKIEISSEESKIESERLMAILNLLKVYKLQGNVTVDLSLARGLDYYTGMIWEFVIYDNKKRLPTIAAGGRYDNLIGMYAKNTLPAVGTSIGISRLLDAMESKEEVKSYAKVFIAGVGDTEEYILAVANRMRAAGINTDINLTKRSLSKQLEYANALGIANVAIVGENEKSQGRVKLRNMESGKEELLDVESAITWLSGG